MTLNLLDLFSGIGGFSLGLERSGAFKTVAFCEIEPYCQKVLEKHWPKVPIYDDVRTITADRLAADGITVDAICGGFPCQDISTAGKKAGLDGERSSLWFEYARIIGELRPRYVIVENVAALLNRGLDRILGELAALRYDAEWHCIPASAVGAYHRRDRLWIIAHTTSGEHESNTVKDKRSRANKFFEASANNDSKWKLQQQRIIKESRGWLSNCSGWAAEPAVDRVVYGVPARSHRLRALGNAVVPQIPELIGRAIAEREAI